MTQIEDRFPFQRAAVLDALANDYRLILNVGCCDDQAQYPPNSLKPLNRERVINCDISAVDELYEDPTDDTKVTGTRPTAAEVLFDAARDTWPFDDRSAALVVLGDILEHMTPDEIRATLTQARRVSARVCITTPEDHRATNTNERADKYRRGHVHRTIVTRPLLESILAETGWSVQRWETVLYDDGRFWDPSTPPGVPSSLHTYGHHVLAT